MLLTANQCSLKINTYIILVLTPEDILTSSAVAVTWGYRVLGNAGWIMSVVVCFSTLGALNGSFITGGRLPFVAARRGHLPKVSVVMWLLFSSVTV